MLRELNASMKALCAIVGEYWHGFLSEDRSSIHPRIDDVNGCSAFFYSCFKCLLPCGKSRKCRK